MYIVTVDGHQNHIKHIDECIGMFIWAHDQFNTKSRGNRWAYSIHIVSSVRKVGELDLGYLISLSTLTLAHYLQVWVLTLMHVTETTDWGKQLLYVKGMSRIFRDRFCI